ncbi:MAG: TetR/AcrR family transcriptional regulator [Saccharospirillum sp.]|uniref:TetR/AcrR family transcriptional regulator n=1 Tax=Saccharospirillum sp. TaxID=2033801 RepID=UPI003296AAF3
MSNTREQLQDRAEHYIRQGGFGSFSFRDLAKDLNIKSASVHYHFPSKSDLGTAVAKRYNQRFEKALPDPATSSLATAELLRLYIRMFYTEMTHSKQVCLCAMLSVERATLTADINATVDAFYALNLNWLTVIFTRDNLPKTQAHQRACQVLATLQGGLIGAWSQQNVDYFVQAARGLYKDLFDKSLRLPKASPSEKEATREA